MKSNLFSFYLINLKCNVDPTLNCNFLKAKENHFNLMALFLFTK